MMQKILRLSLLVILISLMGKMGWGQTLLDSFSDGDFTSNPVWNGNTSSWTIVQSSDAAGGAESSYTLRLNHTVSESGQKYLSTQISTWGDEQEWGFFIGRRKQPFTSQNKMMIWLYANESDLASNTVDGYRISIGDDAGGDEIFLDYVVDGVSSNVTTSSDTLTNGITDTGFLIRVTRNSSGLWTLYTSTLPITSGRGATAIDIPNTSNTNVNQGEATNNSLWLSENGYFGVSVKFSAGEDARKTVELDQVYFTPTNLPALTAISITSMNYSYSQNFNSLASSATSSELPLGWYLSESGTDADTTYTAGTGSSNIGDTYSFGSASSNDRALGGLQTGSLIPTFGVCFKNETGQTITQIPITYTGEQWRLGKLGREDKLDFQYSTNASRLTTGTWTDIDNLDFIAPIQSGSVGALNGDESVNRTEISYIITGLNLLNGATIWFRWMDFDATSSDDGLAIDDFYFNQSESSLPVELRDFNAILSGNFVSLTWTTASEIENQGFNIYRKLLDEEYSLSASFLNDPALKGFGSTSEKHTYHYTDKSTQSGATYTYLLSDVNYAGLEKKHYDHAITVTIPEGKSAIVGKFKLEPIYPNPFNSSFTIPITLPETQLVKIVLYDCRGQVAQTLENRTLPAGAYKLNYTIGDLSSGIYFIKITAGTNCIMRKVALMK